MLRSSRGKITANPKMKQTAKHTNRKVQSGGVAKISCLLFLRLVLNGDHGQALILAALNSGAPLD